MILWCLTPLWGEDMEYSVTSMNTKKIIAESLKKAMLKKPLSRITVSEIIRDCGINRKTFYYHFEDIYALLKWMFEQEAIEVVKNFDLCVDYEEAIGFVMDYVEENDHIISCAYDSMGRDEMKRFFYSDFIAVTSSIIDNSEQICGVMLDPDFKKFACEFYTEALAGMLLNWLQNREARSREKTIRNISDLMKISITALMDKDSGKTV